MNVWKFDENRCDFRPVQPAARSADPDGSYLLSRDGELYLQDGGTTRRIPHDETLIAFAGQLFERDQFEIFSILDRKLHTRRLSPLEIADLQDEMRRDGVRMQRWMRMQARNQP